MTVQTIYLTPFLSILTVRTPKTTGRSQNAPVWLDIGQNSPVRPKWSGTHRKGLEWLCYWILAEMEYCGRYSPVWNGITALVRSWVATMESIMMSLKQFINSTCLFNDFFRATDNYTRSFVWKKMLKKKRWRVMERAQLPVCAWVLMLWTRNWNDLGKISLKPLPFILNVKISWNLFGR